MPTSKWLSALALLAIATVPAIAADNWIKVTTTHFQIYTTGSESAARTALLHFEQVRTFFLQASPFATSLTQPVTIVAFHSDAEYRPYQPSESAASFYTRDTDQDYIVMRDLEPEHFIYATHEFTHLVIGRSGLRLPVWMNEGWADLNSTLTQKGRKAMVGAIIPGRRDALTSQPWIPLDQLDAIDQRSPLYNEREKASVFYGESWALVHMLFLGPEYRKKFNSFVQSIVAGKGLSASCAAVYGKTTREVQDDLTRYIGSSQLSGAVFDISADADHESPTVSVAGHVESGLILADLLKLTHKFPEARDALDRLAKEKPSSPQVHQACGYISISMGDSAEGLRQLKQAYDLGSKDAVMCFRLGVMLHAMSQDRGAAIAAFRRALELQPDYTDARLQLGVTLLEAGDYAASLSELGQIPRVTEANAVWYFSASAMGHAKLGHSEEARKNAELARKWAKTPAQIAQVDQLVKSLQAGK